MSQTFNLHSNPARTLGPGDLWIDPAYFADDDSETAECRAEGCEFDGHKLDELLGDAACLHADAFRPALVQLMAGNAEPLRTLLRQRALIEAQREIDDEIDAARRELDNWKDAA